MSKKASKNNVTADVPSPKPDATTSKIEAIKELIFGENIQEYDYEFESIKADILKKKNELEALIDTTKRELLQSLDSINTDVNIRITELDDKVNEQNDTLNDKKLDRQLLGDLLIKLGEKISQ